MYGGACTSPGLRGSRNVIITSWRTARPSPARTPVPGRTRRTPDPCENAVFHAPPPEVRSRSSRSAQRSVLARSSAVRCISFRVGSRKRRGFRRLGKRSSGRRAGAGGARLNFLSNNITRRVRILFTAPVFAKI